MIGQSKNLGNVLDELVQNRRRLAIAHSCLGLVSAIIYWVRPGSFTPSLPIYNLQDPSPVFDTVIAWAPYVVSFFASRAILAERSSNVVLVFIVFATGIGLASAVLSLRLSIVHVSFSPIVASAGVTVALVAVAGLCAAASKKRSP
jgi:hypothetical protein